MGILKRLDQAADKRIDRAIGSAPAPRPVDEVAQKRAEKQGRK